MILEQLDKFVQECNASNSMKQKAEVVRKYPDLCPIFKFTYDTINFTFGIKSARVKKLKNLGPGSFNYDNLLVLLCDLAEKKITGHDAVKAVNSLVLKVPQYEDLIYRIIDRNLKTRTDAKIINQIFPGTIEEFNIALAETYEDGVTHLDFKNDIWYASRKLDGVRGFSIPELDITRMWSRQKKEFQTLGLLKAHIQTLGVRDQVLDGEVCLIDDEGSEDFQRIMKVIRKKNFTIPNVRFKLFDCIPLKDFNNEYSEVLPEARWATLREIVARGNNPMLSILDQVRIHDDIHFEQLRQLAIRSQWEGLILRKSCPYEGKRSKGMYKVKIFIEAEFVVQDVEMGPIRYIDKTTGLEKEEVMLSAVMIPFKDAITRVGSGFSLAERQQYFKDPSSLIGATITVKYFEETIDETGKPSLRFPSLKYIWEEGERDV